MTTSPFARLRLPPWWPQALTLAAALLLGTVAAWAAHRYLTEAAQSLSDQARRPTVDVVVAAHDLTAGTVLDPSVVAIRPMPREWAPHDALLPTAFDQASGSWLMQPARRGEPLRWVQLQHSQRSPFSAQLAPGRRAITLPVDEINSLSGMLEPGDSIDLYVSFEHQQERVIAPLLQQMRVLATGQQHDGATPGDGMAGYAAVTLDVSPDEAVRLIAARQQGVISAVLRLDADESAPDVAPHPAAGDLATLLGLRQPLPARPTPIPVIYGNQPVAPRPVAVPSLLDAFEESP